MKVIKWVHYQFMCDYDERAPVSEMLLFYGFNIGSLTIGAILLGKILGGF